MHLNCAKRSEDDGREGAKVSPRLKWAILWVRVESLALLTSRLGLRLQLGLGGRLAGSDTLLPAPWYGILKRCTEGKKQRRKVKARSFFVGAVRVSWDVYGILVSPLAAEALPTFVSCFDKSSGLPDTAKLLEGRTAQAETQDLTDSVARAGQPSRLLFHHHAGA